MGIKDIISPFTAWKNLVVEPVTIKDPIKDKLGAPRYRGFHKNNLEACIGCGTCEAICPEVFKMEDVDGKMIAKVLDADYDALKGKIDEAINACPVTSIK